MPARNRHCEEAFSADKAILQLSLVASALRLFICAVVFKGIHELNRSVIFVPRNDDLSMESNNDSLLKDLFKCHAKRFRQALRRSPLDNVTSLNGITNMIQSLRVFVVKLRYK